MRLGDDGCVSVGVGDVQTPSLQLHPAPGCTPRQFPAPPAPVCTLDPPAPLVDVDAAFGSNCQMPFWQTHSGPGASPEQVDVGVLPFWLWLGPGEIERRLVVPTVLEGARVMTVGSVFGVSAKSNTVHAVSGARSHKRCRL